MEIIGQKFNNITIIRDLGRFDKNGTGNVQRYVEVECKCGNVFQVLYNSVKGGNTKSCGCHKKKVARESMKANRYDWSKHGMSREKIYKVWTSMKQRCENEKEKYYHRYGGRGISVCEEWTNEKDGFINFYNWAVDNGYEEGLSIDRVENDGDYEPSNCQWITISENSKKIKTDREKRMMKNE